MNPQTYYKRYSRTIVALIRYLHFDRKKTYAEIARMEAFTPIPPGTLHAIVKKKSVPKKWRKRLGCVYYRDWLYTPDAEIQWSFEYRLELPDVTVKEPDTDP